MKLLCLSNGHGEDVIAVEILKQLLSQTNHTVQIQALPLVGEGKAYARAQIESIGPVAKMPSGGFIYQDIRQLGRDLQGGLLGLTLGQFKAVSQWYKQHQGIILTVGDIVPLLFAWLTGANYFFVGTAKSDYYLRSEKGWLATSSWLERLNRSVYLPHERWLMSQPRCLGVFPRDHLTASILLDYKLPVFDLGNPMMDGITPDNLPFSPSTTLSKEGLTVLLLPGSRFPEAFENWKIIVCSITLLMAKWGKQKINFLAAIAPSLDLKPFEDYLQARGWKYEEDSFYADNASLTIKQNAYGEYLLRGDVAIAMAGTACEQFVGLGKPAIIIPGGGPQFTYAFAEAQRRLLGSSVIFVLQPEGVAEAIEELLSNPQRLKDIAENGLRRMGSPGAARRIAETLIKLNKDL